MVAISNARDLARQHENRVRLMNQTQSAELKEHEKERDIFCLVSDAFRIFARRSSLILGSAWAFAAAILIIVAWAVTGPMFNFSNTWQLIINTGTTIVTFLMVFLIQNTQNRDSKAMHLKLDEIIRALTKARNELVDLENLSDEELDKLENQFRRLRTKAENHGTNMRNVEPEMVEPHR
jgi:low affinity Fe/Cu permease